MMTIQSLLCPQKLSPVVICRETNLLKSSLQFITLLGLRHCTNPQLQITQMRHGRQLKTKGNSNHLLLVRNVNAQTAFSVKTCRGHLNSTEQSGHLLKLRPKHVLLNKAPHCAQPIEASIQGYRTKMFYIDQQRSKQTW